MVKYTSPSKSKDYFFMSHLASDTLNIVLHLIHPFLCVGIKFRFYVPTFMLTNLNLPLFVSYAQIAIAKVPTTIRINPASAFLLNFSLNTK